MLLTHYFYRLALAVPLNLGLLLGLAAPGYGQTIGIGSFQDSAVFTDTKGHWATLCLDGLGTEGLMKGYEDRSFRPDGTMTRAEFAAVMIQAFPDAPNVRSAPEFADVADDFWGRGAIATAYQKGFLSGYPNNTFKPAQPISRVQAIVVVANAQQLSPLVNSEALLQQYFDDAQTVPTYAKGLTAAATQQALIVNYPTASQLRANDNITRAEASALLCRLNADGTDARYFVADRYIPNFGSDTENIALPNATVLHEITTGIAGLFHTYTAMGDKLFFALSDNIWESDGTPQGTQVFSDLETIDSRLTRGLPKVIAASSQRFWITARASVENGTSDLLLSSDGTATGTVSVETLHPELPDLFEKNADLVAATEPLEGDRLPFVLRGETGMELWITDGKSTTGTRRLATFDNIETNFNRELIYGLVPEPLTVSGEYVFFQVMPLGRRDTLEFGDNYDDAIELWRSDGTVEGTVSLGLVAPATANTTRTAPANRIYTQVEKRETGWEIWSSDGTPNSAQELLATEPKEPFIAPGLLTTLGDRFFTLVNLQSGLELWTTQGNAASTQRVKRLSSKTEAQDNPWSATADGKLFFNPLVAKEEPVTGLDRSYELWVTDGTAEGTQKINEDVKVSEEGFTEFKGRLFFIGTSETTGPELWTTDGTSEGTYQVIDLVPGVDYFRPPCLPPAGVSDEEYCRPDAVARGGRVRSLTVHGDFLYFIADDSDLFRTDGTAKTIQHVKSFVGDLPYRSFPSNIAKVNDTLFIAGFGDDSVFLWALPEE